MKQITSYPTTDRRVYVRAESSCVFERGAVIVEYDDEKSKNQQMNIVFTDIDGHIIDGTHEVKNWDILCEWDRYHYIGTVGEKITPARLGEAIDACEIDLIEILRFAEEYFHIDKSEAPDTLVLRVDFDVFQPEKGLMGRIDNKSSWYSFGIRPIFIDFTKLDYYRESSYGVLSNLISTLAGYSLYLGKEIKLDIDFSNCTNCYESEKIIIQKNNLINKYRKQYLSKFRKYILEKYNWQRTQMRDNLNIDFDTDKYEKKYKDYCMDGKILTLNSIK